MQASELLDEKEASNPPPVSWGSARLFKHSSGSLNNTPAALAKCVTVEEM